MNKNVLYSPENFGFTSTISFFKKWNFEQTTSFHALTYEPKNKNVSLGATKKNIAKPLKV